MPELPDIELYRAVLAPRVVGEVLERALVTSVFVLRSVEPPIDVIEGKRVVGVERLGKRVVLAFEDELFLVVHLMIAGRFRWIEPEEGGKARAGAPSKIELARLRFDSGLLLLTEASPKKRASMHVVRGREGLRAHDPGGIEPLECSAAEFRAAMTRQNRTLKRAVTDPASISGIGNAYSDEILHAARLSPIAMTGKLDDAQHAALFEATRATLTMWCERLRREFATRFPGPGDVTAFRPEFAVHGKFEQACPVCGHKVARIVRAENEINYCPTCQTDGKVLADRSLSRILKDEWPRTVEEWESPGSS